MPIRYGSESCFGNLSQFSVSYYYVDRNVILQEIIAIDDHSDPVSTFDISDQIPLQTFPQKSIVVAITQINNVTFSLKAQRL